MPKLRLITFTLLALSAATAVHAEEKRYVSDELSTWVRSGPGDVHDVVRRAAAERRRPSRRRCGGRRAAAVCRGLTRARGTAGSAPLGPGEALIGAVLSETGLAV